MALFSGERERGGRLYNPRTEYFAYPEEAPQAESYVRQEDMLGRDVYHAAHLFTTPLRRKETAAPVRALYVDLDGGELTDAPQPTLIVESSPYRLQCYWRLDRPLSPASAEDYNRRLAYLTHGDPSGWDLTQLLRIPGTHNRKYEGSPEVRVRRAVNARYHPGVFDRLPQLPQDVRIASKPPQIRAEMRQDVSHVLDGRAVVKKADGTTDRSASLYLMALVLHDSGMADPEVMAVLEERDVALGWNKFSERRDKNARYQAIVSAVKRRAPGHAPAGNTTEST
jgi:hypothetical protein